MFYAHCAQTKVVYDEAEPALIQTVRCTGYRQLLVCGLE